MTVKELQKRREEILQQMFEIESMRRGSITEQYLKVRSKGREEPELRGPYYVFSRREGSKTASSRLKNEEELKQAQKDVEEYKRFVSLCKEYEEVTERLGELTRNEKVEASKKKRRKLRLKKMRR